MNRTRNILAVVVLIGGLGLTACSSDADVASKNLSKDADNFKIFRRVVFYNGITDRYVIATEGYCSVGNNDAGDRVSITCKVEDGKYVKHIFLKSDNTTVFAQQLTPAEVSVARYKVSFKPETIIPDIDLRTGESPDSGDTEEGGQ